MSWKQQYQSATSRQWGRVPMVAAGVLAASLFVGAVVLLGSLGSNRTDNPLHNHAAQPTVTNVAGEVIDPESLPADEVVPHDHELDEEAFLNDYTTEAMPISVWEERNPPSQSGLEPNLREEIKNRSAALVRADATLQGREQFPNYWSEFTPTTALANPFQVDYAWAGRVSDYPELARGVVFWSGETWAGYRVIQFRQAVYFQIEASGDLTPLRIEDLPRDIRYRDLLLDGISITE